MGKVREISDHWAKICGSVACFNFRSCNVEQLACAEKEDAAAHAAELEAKDRRIAELSGDLLDARTRLEAELAKLKELPPLPDDVREEVERWRICYGQSLRPLIAWVDAHYPRPVPQWELDARMAEDAATWISEEKLRSGLRAIAVRIREAHRDAK